MIAFNLLGTQKNSGTKTFNTNFFKETINFNYNEKIIVYVPKFYLNNQGLESSDKIKIIVKSELLDNFFIRFIWLQFILPIELKIKNVKDLVTYLRTQFPDNSLYMERDNIKEELIITEKNNNLFFIEDFYNSINININ